MFKGAFLIRNILTRDSYFCEKLSAWLYNSIWNIWWILFNPRAGNPLLFFKIFRIFCNNNYIIINYTWVLIRCCTSTMDISVINSHFHKMLNRWFFNYFQCLNNAIVADLLCSSRYTKSSAFLVTWYLFEIQSCYFNNEYFDNRQISVKICMKTAKFGFLTGIFRISIQFSVKVQ